MERTMSFRSVGSKKKGSKMSVSEMLEKKMAIVKKKDADIGWRAPPTPGPGAYELQGGYEKTARCRTAPALTMGKKLPVTWKEIERKIGIPEPPAPGGNVEVPSFAKENERGRKGVVFGGRLKSWKEIERKLGFPEPPAPGGMCRIPSFVEDNKVQAKGVVFGGKLKSWREIERNLGFPEPPGPGGSCRIPSFVEDNKQQNKGVVFGGKLKSWRDIERNLGYPEPPAPGGMYRVPSFVYDGRVENKGVKFGVRVKSDEEIAEACGFPKPPGPGTYDLTKPLVQELPGSPKKVEPKREYCLWDKYAALKRAADKVAKAAKQAHAKAQAKKKGDEGASSRTGRTGR